MRRKVFTKPLPNLFATTILLSIFILQSHGKFDPLEPMTTGDTETFYIDSTKKTADVGRRCLVNANTYKVRKTKQNGNQLKFMAILGNLPALKDSAGKPVPDESITDAFYLSNQIAEAYCKIGYIRFVHVEPHARNCGLAKVLTELCLIDPDVNRNTDENWVISQLKAVKNDQSSHLQELMKNRCVGGLVGLVMSSDPLEGGFAYLSAAKNMLYSHMLVQFYHAENFAPRENPHEPGPCEQKFGTYETSVAQGLYNGDTGRIEDEVIGAEGSGEGARWYFCKMDGTFRTFQRKNFLGHLLKK